MLLVLFLIVKPMNKQTSSPIITAAIPCGPTPLGELARPKLCAKAAPIIIPRTKMAASPSPSPDKNNCLPGQPPARAKQSPARTMPRKFHK